MDMKKVGPPPIELKVVNRLLDLLSTDDDFRLLFVEDASAALAQAGYVLPEGATAHPAFCMKVDRLASKENIVRDRAKLEKSLNAIQGFMAPKEMRDEA